MPDETISVVYEKLGSIGGQAYYHETLVYKNAAGDIVAIATSGPTISPPGNQFFPFSESAVAAKIGLPSLYGFLHATIGAPSDFQQTDLDRLLGTAASPNASEVAVTGLDLSSQWNVIVQKEQQISSENLPYSPFSQNSNSMATTALVAAGIQPPTDARGSDSTFWVPAYDGRLAQIVTTSTTDVSGITLTTITDQSNGYSLGFLSTADGNTVNVSAFGDHVVFDNGVGHTQDVMTFSAGSQSQNFVGTKIQNDGSIVIQTTIGPGNTVELKNDQTLNNVLPNLAKVSPVFLFSGSSGTLKLDNPFGFSGTIYGFAGGDKIDLGGQPGFFNSFVFDKATNTLELGVGTQTINLAFDPSVDYGAPGVSFGLTGDGPGVLALTVIQNLIASSGQTISNALLGSGDTLTVQAGGNASGITVNKGGSEIVAGLDTNSTVNDGGLQTVKVGGVADNTTVNDPGIQTVSSGGTANNAILSGGDQLVFGTANNTVVDNGGLQVVESGGTANGTTINAGGLVVVSGGGIIEGAIVINGGTLELQTEAVINEAVRFTGVNGILQVDDLASAPAGVQQTDFKSAVDGFAPTDILKVEGFGNFPAIDEAAPTYNAATNTTTLAFMDGGSPVAALEFTGDYSDDSFTVTTDLKVAGTIDVAFCFMPGTMIRTPHGEAAVESLRRGDLVATIDGRQTAVRWIGRQAVSTRFGDPLRILPIRIKRGAIGENVPSRDFLLSPDHAIRISDVLIQAGALVNGISIVRESNVPATFIYYHVELDDHSLILAENTPAETFVDNVDRMAFDNWNEYEALYPDGRSIEEMPYPRAKAYRQVPQAVRAMLAAREAMVCHCNEPVAA
jgi:autotransporter passenger strand-loop-strand repeat protein